MRLRPTLLSLGFLVLLTAVTRPMSPEQLVKRAHLIVRATALGYYRPPTLPRAGRGPLFPATNALPLGVISFRIDSVLKGKAPAAMRIDLEGRMVADDEINEGEVPYRTARRSPDDYVAGAEYLLILQQDRRGEYNTWWAAPSASNERIRGENDPWLQWIRERVAKESR